MVGQTPGDCLPASSNCLSPLHPRRRDGEEVTCGYTGRRGGAAWKHDGLWAAAAARTGEKRATRDCNSCKGAIYRRLTRYDDQHGSQAPSVDSGEELPEHRLFGRRMSGSCLPVLGRSREKKKTRSNKRAPRSSRRLCHFDTGIGGILAGYLGIRAPSIANDLDGTPNHNSAQNSPAGHSSRRPARDWDIHRV